MCTQRFEPTVGLAGHTIFSLACSSLFCLTLSKVKPRHASRLELACFGVVRLEAAWFGLQLFLTFLMSFSSNKSTESENFYKIGTKCIKSHLNVTKKLQAKSSCLKPNNAKVSQFKLPQAELRRIMPKLAGWHGLAKLGLKPCPNKRLQANGKMVCPANWRSARISVCMNPAKNFMQKWRTMMIKSFEKKI